MPLDHFSRLLYLIHMIHRKLPGLDVKSQIEMQHKNRVHTFLLANDTVRAHIVDGTFMVQKMQLHHETNPLESLLLGHGYLAGGLLSATIKNDDRLSLSLEGDGPAKGIQISCTASGEVKGYLMQQPIPIEQEVDPNNLGIWFGKGHLSMTRFMSGKSTPFTGTTEMIEGTLAQDLAYYYTTSEQTPSAFHLSIQFDKEGKIVGAGGLMLQALPGADEKDVDLIQKQMNLLPSLGTELSHGWTVERYFNEWFQNFNPREINSRLVDFVCHCNKERFGKFLQGMADAEKEDIKEHGPFPLILKCFNCNSEYQFSKEETHELL